MKEEKIYRIDDKISFRLCSLSEKSQTFRGNCTSFYQQESNWVNYYHCNSNGVHLHCTTHPSIELDIKDIDYSRSKSLVCPKCKNSVEIDDLDQIYQKCFRMLNMEKLKDTKLIRLDDWYIPEIKEKVDKIPNYWIKSEVKTDKDGDTIIVLYLGYKGEKSKVQYFIKPEKGQLTSDHKDLDPSQLLSKIEVTLKDKKIIHDFE